MKELILPLLIMILITIAATWSTNNVKLDIGARGQTEKLTYDGGLDLVDANLGTAKTLTIKGSVEAGDHQTVPESSLIAPVGSLFIKTSGSAPHDYFNESGTGNSGAATLWAAGQDRDAEYLKRAEGGINSFSEKVTPLSADLTLIKDKGAGYAKNKVQPSNPPGGGGGSTPLKLLGNPGFETLANAKRTIGKNQATLVIPAGTYNITSDPDYPSNIELLMMKGAIFNISSGVTMTILGPFRAGNNRHFTFGSSTAKVRFGDDTELNAVWFINGGDGSEDYPWTGAEGGGGIGEAIAHNYYADSYRGAYIYLPPGRFSVTETINCNRSGIYIRGAGLHAYSGGTKIQFSPTSAKVLFNYENTVESDLLYYGGVSGVTLFSNSYANTMIKLFDVSQMKFSDIRQFEWTNGIGIHICGREMTSFERIFLDAKRPIVISKNTRAPYLDCDAFTFKDMQILCRDNGTYSACVYVDDGCNIDHLNFSGWQDWLIWHYGFYFVTTTSIEETFNLDFRNIKVENSYNPAPQGWVFYISHNIGVRNLNIENCNDSEAEGGFVYLRGVHNAKICNLKHDTPNANIFDIADVHNLILMNIYSTQPIGKLSGMYKALAVEAGGYEKIAFAVYTDSTPTVTVYGK